MMITAKTKSKIKKKTVLHRKFHHTVKQKKERSLGNICPEMRKKIQDNKRCSFNLTSMLFIGPPIQYNTTKTQ